MEMLENTFNKVCSQSLIDSVIAYFNSWYRSKEIVSLNININPLLFDCFRARHDLLWIKKSELKLGNEYRVVNESIKCSQCNKIYDVLQIVLREE